MSALIEEEKAISETGLRKRVERAGWTLETRIWGNRKLYMVNGVVYTRKTFRHLLRALREREETRKRVSGLIDSIFDVDDPVELARLTDETLERNGVE